MTRTRVLVIIALLTACAAPPRSAQDGQPSARESLTPSSAAPTAPSTEPSSSPTEEPAPTTWSELAATGPSAREDHTWTADSAGRTAYLFGGRDGSTVFGDLWAFDLATDTWSQVTAAGAQPPARFGHETVWVDGIGLVVVFGQSGASFYNDLWVFDPEGGGGTWRQLPATGAVPLARYGSCAAVGPDGRLWISHGFTSENARFSDTRAYDFGTGTWTDETPAGDLPVIRCLHGCWWTDDDALRLYGGQTNGVTALGDLWELTRSDAPAWTRIGEQLPAERNLYSRARVDSATIVFGGQGIDGAYRNDAFVLADGEETAIPLVIAGEWPSGRAGAEMVLDAGRSRLLLFGGRDADGVRDDLWQLSNPPTR